MSPPRCQLLFCAPADARCSANELCEQGLGCKEGLCARCNGCGDKCIVDFATDRDHCGVCDQAVAAEQDCAGGKPVCRTATLTACGGACVDLKTDKANCGACGQKATEACEDGAPTCNSPSKTYCGSTDGCRNLTNDSNHCTACDKKCAAGSCVTSDGKTRCEHALTSKQRGSCDSLCGALGMQCTATGKARYLLNQTEVNGLSCADIPGPNEGTGSTFVSIECSCAGAPR